MILLVQVRMGDIVGSLSDDGQAAWWTVAATVEHNELGEPSHNGDFVSLTAWDGRDMGTWGASHLVTVLRRVEPASDTQDAPIMAQRASETPSRPYSGNGKRKGCKWDRRRSNSRMRKVARA